MKQSPLYPNGETESYSNTPWAVGAQVFLSVNKAILGGKFMGSAPDGRSVWIKSNAPLAIGDLVGGEVTKVAKRSFEVFVQSIHKPSQDRQDTFCPHVESCGGCPWQALSLSDQLNTLTRDISRMMTRSIGQEIRWDKPFFDSKQRWRCTARIHCDEQGHLGFYGSQGLFNLDDCPILSETLNQQLQALKVDIAPLLKGGRAEIRLSAAENADSGTVYLSLHGLWPTHMINKLIQTLKQLNHRYDVIHGITLEAHTRELLNTLDQSKHASHNRRKHSRKFKTKRDRKNQSRRKTRASRESHSPTVPPETVPIHTSWGHTYNDLNGVAHPASAFMQAHQIGNKALIETVIRDAKRSKNILELYAGSGNFTVALAQDRSDRQILALEYDARAVEALNTLAEQKNLNIRAEAQSINSLPQGDFDHIILDPPRAGAAPIIEALAQSSVHYITYISCHPAALARDLESLSNAGWTIDRAQLFHLFPHSGHAEVYCHLKKTE